MRDFARRILEAALTEWWFTNTVIWIGIIALILWLDRWLT